MSRRAGFIDDQGRVFGRINLLDAAIGLLVLILIPLAYVAFLLFRTPRPRITAVTPAQLTYIEDRAAGGSDLSGKLKVFGSGLRPVLRASIGTQEALAFIFESPASADVLFGNIEPGTHDLILYDGVQEVARAPHAVTIPPKGKPATARVRVAGALIDLDAETAKALRVGTKYPAAGEAESVLVALGDVMPDVRTLSQPGGAVEVSTSDRWQRAAAFIVDCDVSASNDCRIGSVSLTGVGALLHPPGAPGPLLLRVQEIVPATPPQPAQVRVRLMGPVTVADLVRVGDRDESAPDVDGRAAMIVALNGRQIAQGDLAIPVGRDADLQPVSGVGATDRVAIIDALMTLGADRTSTGWQYRSHPISAGRPLTFVTPRYVIRGIVQSVTVADAAPAK